VQALRVLAKPSRTGQDETLMTGFKPKTEADSAISGAFSKFSMPHHP
jgi:hypothetical protein